MRPEDGLLIPPQSAPVQGLAPALAAEHTDKGRQGVEPEEKENEPENGEGRCAHGGVSFAGGEWLRANGEGSPPGSELAGRPLFPPLPALEGLIKKQPVIAGRNGAGENGEDQNKRDCRRQQGHGEEKEKLAGGGQFA